MSLPPGWSRKALCLHLYEIAVTNAQELARFAQALAPKARTLREDFAGSASLARAWVQRSPLHRAIAVELDASVAIFAGEHGRLRVVVGDATRCARKADIIAATNFPLGYLHSRSALLAYLRKARSSLHAKGVLFADLYGGDGCFQPVVQSRRLRSAIVGPFTYEWEQRSASASTGLVENHIHFRVGPLSLTSAFVYRWRLWSLPEVRDAAREAGFRDVHVHDRLADALDEQGNAYVQPMREADRLDPTWVAYVVCRK
jgi:hypothetical protein